MSINFNEYSTNEYQLTKYIVQLISYQKINEYSTKRYECSSNEYQYSVTQSLCNNKSVVLVCSAHPERVRKVSHSLMEYTLAVPEYKPNVTCLFSSEVSEVSDDELYLNILTYFQHTTENKMWCFIADAKAAFL